MGVHAVCKREGIPDISVAWRVCGYKCAMQVVSGAGVYVGSDVAESNLEW